MTREHVDDARSTSRLCPTRADGGETLIAQWIHPGGCQARQREQYHKCHTCAHRNGAPLVATGERTAEGVQTASIVGD